MVCSGGSEETGSMLSPVYKANPHGRCLSFWSIAMSSNDWMDVLTRDKEGHEKKVGSVLSFNEWKIHRINVQQRTDFQVCTRKPHIASPGQLIKSVISFLCIEIVFT